MLALLVVVALPSVGTLLQPSIDRTSRLVALAIRDQRSTAMRTGTMVMVTAATIAPLLPNGTKLELDQLGEPGLLFFPMGTTTGGRLVLAGFDGRRAIEIDWPTGRVRVKMLQ